MGENSFGISLLLFFGDFFLIMGLSKSTENSLEIHKSEWLLMAI